MAGPLAVEGEFELLGDLMDAAAEQIGEVEAIVDGTRRLTFAAWVRGADGVANSLRSQGVEHGDVVALHIANGADYALAYAAAVRLGAITTGLNPRLGAAEVESILRRCDPRVLVIEDDADVPAGFGGSVMRRGEVEAAASGPPFDVRPQSSAEDPICIIWTSGTTGLPKGAWFDHRNQAAAVASAGVMTGRFDRRLAGIPFAHAGFMAKLWEHFAMGLTLVLPPAPWSAETMLDVMLTEQITVAAGVPTQWEKLVGLPRLDDVELPPLRLGLSATAPASPELIAQVAARLGCPLVVRYAMTESPSITGTDPEDPPAVQYRTVGRPQGDMRVQLVDPDGNEVARGDVGRVCVRGGAVMRGYWGAPELTADVLDADGWLLSGDLGRFDPEGNLVLAGRVDDMYIRGGYNVYPVEVENVLAEHPAVGQVAVVGQAAPVIGEIGVAFVVAAGASPTLDELRKWSADRLADYKAPDRLEIVDELPLTPMMKVDKSALRSRLG